MKYWEPENINQNYEKENNMDLIIILDTILYKKTNTLYQKYIKMHFWDSTGHRAVNNIYGTFLCSSVVVVLYYFFTSYF